MEMDSDTPDDLLDRFVGAAGKVQEILDGTCEPRLYAAELERCRFGLLYLRQVHFQEVLRIAHTRVGMTHGLDRSRCVDGYASLV